MGNSVHLCFEALNLFLLTYLQVILSPDATPPVVKIMDYKYGVFFFLEEELHFYLFFHIFFISRERLNSVFLYMYHKEFSGYDCIKSEQ